MRMIGSGVVSSSALRLARPTPRLSSSLAPARSPLGFEMVTEAG